MTENIEHRGPAAPTGDPAPANCAIEVLSVEPGATSSLVATVAVRVGGIVIRSVRVNDRGRGTFVNWPARRDGDKWIPLVELVSPALRDAVEAVILRAVGAVRL